MLEKPVYICRLCGKENNSFDKCDCRKKQPLIWDNSARDTIAEKIRNIKAKFNKVERRLKKNE